MDIEAGKSMAKQYKLALAIAIIRQKPPNMSLSEFMCLLQLKYKTAYTDNTTKIKQLENELLKMQQELFMLKNKNLIETFHQNATQNTLNAYLQSQSHTAIPAPIVPQASEPIKTFSDYANMKQKYEQHKEFLINLIKLKIIGKNFSLNENTQIILSTLTEFLEQIKFYFFQKTNIADTCDTPMEQQSYVPCTPPSSNYEGLNQQQQQEQQQTCQDQFNFSYDCLIHSMQIFLNVFQVEWLYYLRSNLIGNLVQFMDDLVKFVLEFNKPKSSRMQLQCACELLVCLSTCDYLIENLLNSILYALQTLIKYLCESTTYCSTATTTSSTSNPKEHESADIDDTKSKNDYLIENCVDLLDCLDKILQIRLLKYYTKLNSNLILNLNKLIDFMFIHLTDVYPILAVKLTKLLQILNK